MVVFYVWLCLFFFQAEDGIRDYKVTGVQTCALPISYNAVRSTGHSWHDRAVPLLRRSAASHTRTRSWRGIARAGPESRNADCRQGRSRRRAGFGGASDHAAYARREAAAVNGPWPAGRPERPQQAGGLPHNSSQFAQGVVPDPARRTGLGSDQRLGGIDGCLAQAGVALADLAQGPVDRLLHEIALVAGGLRYEPQSRAELFVRSLLIVDGQAREQRERGAALVFGLAAGPLAHLAPGKRGLPKQSDAGRIADRPAVEFAHPALHFFFRNLQGVGDHGGQHAGFQDVRGPERGRQIRVVAEFFGDRADDGGGDAVGFGGANAVAGHADDIGGAARGAQALQDVVRARHAIP